ncbi:MAG: hypothetical protein NC110_00760 [Ruminococcus sp.]|nr:hypothetical protein [Ruminococcus sp.]
MANKDIRAKAKEKGVYLWKIADILGVCDMTFTRKMRHELPEDEKAKIFAIIDELAEAK